jgi:hypothetical protein
LITAFESAGRFLFRPLRGLWISPFAAEVVGPFGDEKKALSVGCWLGVVLFFFLAGGVAGACFA